jgi:hypothetical protein
MACSPFPVVGPEGVVSTGLWAASVPPQRGRAPISGAGLLLSLAVAATAAAGFSLDPVLVGMVAAGQGIHAICLYLGLTRTALDDHLARLGLERPHDRPLRKAGPRGWSEFDTRRLIVWRVHGIHPETIGQRLGRSANAVRAKARRLGIPRPDRKSLQRVDPASLEDPAPLFAGGADAESSEASLKSPSAVCGTVPGPLGVRGGTDATAAVMLPPSVPVSEAPAIARPLSDESVRRRAGQPELSLLPGVPRKELPSGQDEAPRPGVVTVPPQAWPLVIELEQRLQQRIKVEIRLRDVVIKLADIGWVGETKRVLRDAAAVLALSLRYFGGQHWKWIAQDAGMHGPQLASDLTRIRLPRDFDRWKFRKTYNLECALYTLLDSDYRLRWQEEKGTYEWINARDLRNVHQSWEVRRQQGFDDEGQGRRRESPRITLVTPRELPERRPQTRSAPAGGWPKAGLTGAVGSSSYRKSPWFDQAAFA